MINMIKKIWYNLKVLFSKEHKKDPRYYDKYNLRDRDWDGMW